MAAAKTIQVPLLPFSTLSPSASSVSPVASSGLTERASDHFQDSLLCLDLLDIKTSTRTPATRSKSLCKHGNSHAFSANADLFTEHATVTSHRQPASSHDETRVCVVGVGFVGESLLRLFSNKVDTIGYDISEKRIQQLQESSQFTPSAIRERIAKYDTVDTPTDMTPPPSPKIQPLVQLTSDEAALLLATHFVISVPTLLKPDGTTNLDYVRAAVATVLRHARPGSTIIIESSVAVGTTRALLGSHTQTHHIGMSPERVDPGRTTPQPRDIPKLVSGLTPAALDAVDALYARVFATTVRMSSPEAAELTKLHENCFRMVNIAYANEVADAARSLALDPAEIVAAAATKPYGFMPFAPGLGVGGHCIPVNPLYLLSTCPHLPVLERATRGMAKRPHRLARKFHRRCVLQAARRASCKGARVRPRILVVGLGFKPGESVLSHSPGVDFGQALRDAGCARLAFYDPLVAADAVPWLDKVQDEGWVTEMIDGGFDGVAVCVRQTGVDWDVLDRLKKAFVREYV